MKNRSSRSHSTTNPDAAEIVVSLNEEGQLRYQLQNEGVPVACCPDGKMKVCLLEKQGYQQEITLRPEGDLRLESITWKDKPYGVGRLGDTPLFIEVFTETDGIFLTDFYEGPESVDKKFHFTIHCSVGKKGPFSHDPEIHNIGMSGGGPGGSESDSEGRGSRKLWRFLRNVIRKFSPFRVS